MAKTMLNGEGRSAALALIRAGHYDMTSAWSFDAADGDALLGPNGDDWDRYGRWHLGEDASEARETKAHWKYPYGKEGKVYRRAVSAIRSRAAQQGDDTVYAAAGELMTAMDDEEDKKEGSTMGLKTIIGSRFGHFAGAAAAAAADPAATDDEAAKAAATAAAAKEAEDEAARKAEEEEEMKRSRRSRRGAARRQMRQRDDDEEEDDAADDDEEEEDEEEMKRAASRGHGTALEAAFRSGARAQRRRCARIFAAPSAAANPVLAMSLAFETTMTAAAAIGVLDKAPAPAARPSLADRMAASGAGQLRVGAGAPEAPKGAAAVAASWDHALKDLMPAH